MAYCSTSRSFLIALPALLVSCSDANPPRDQVQTTSNDAGGVGDGGAPGFTDDPAKAFAARMIDEGRQIFRFDTFGSEAFWGDIVGLHRAIAGEANGGVGPGLTPATALSLGLKVDMDAIPPELASEIAAGRVDLNDPATTLALLQLNAVIGVTGFFEGEQLTSVGIQCALCHTNVDNAFAPGIGHRLDGWANRDLDIGAIVALGPNLEPFSQLLGVSVDTVRQVLTSWGPGKYDAALILDGKAFRPDGRTAATLIPPAFGQAGLSLHTYTAWGSTPYWNASVAVLQMHGQGNFYDPRLDDAEKFPIAARNNLGHVRVEQDLVSPKLPALHFYQVSLAPPTPPPGSFDAAAAERGAVLFRGQAQCTNCHFEGVFTEAGWPVHRGADIGIDEFQANRSPEGGYRTAPLRGLFSHAQGGFYHDGRFPTLLDVVRHYNDFFDLGLGQAEMNDLVEYLKSL